MNQKVIVQRITTHDNYAAGRSGITEEIPIFLNGIPNEESQNAQVQSNPLLHFSKSYDDFCGDCELSPGPHNRGVHR